MQKVQVKAQFILVKDMCTITVFPEINCGPLGATATTSAITEQLFLLSNNRSYQSKADNIHQAFFFQGYLIFKRTLSLLKNFSLCECILFLICPSDIRHVNIKSYMPSNVSNVSTYDL